MAATLKSIMKSGCRQIVRRLYMKRYRSGAFESTWVDITNYVVSFGSISEGFGDEQYLGSNSMPSFSVILSNRQRKFQPETENSSFFYGYASRNKTKFKISISYLDNTYYYSSIYPGATLIYNSETEVSARNFYGIVLGDPQNDDSGLITFNLTSLLTVFKWFPFEGDVDTTALTSAIVDRSVKRTQSSVRIFDQYFEGVDDAAKYQITTGTITLNPYISDKSKSILDKIWDYGLVENYFPWINTDGNFVWKSKDATALTQWYFNGGSISDNDYGCNIISVNSDKQGKESLFTRIVIGYAIDTEGSMQYVSADTSWAVGDGGTVDLYGLLALDVTIMDLTALTAATTASFLLSEYNTIKRELEITTPLMPNLVPADKVEVNYIGEISSPTPFVLGVSLLGGTDVLTEKIGSIFLQDFIGKIIFATHDLDNCVSKFIIREV